MRSLNGSSLTLVDMPRIWLSNQADYLHLTDKGAPGDNNLKTRSPLYLPGWSLRPGFHVEAEVGLIIRRFIKSSMLRDLVFNIDPVRSISLLNVD